MNGFISKADAINVINSVRISGNDKGKDVSLVWECADAILQIPAADVKPNVRGEWIKIVDQSGNEICVQCSECLEDFDYIDGVFYLCHGYELPLFCPNCGADMRGEQDD